ncbi:MAG TPA: GNAT family N-acetyltransferase [Ktedonobacterales bacterium]|jgi:RimJ/RimL family protein N-acetyltransferase
MTMHRRPATHLGQVTIRPLEEQELPEATRIFRLAFGTFLGVPDPSMFWADTEHVQTRWSADPTRVFAAEAEGILVGSNVATRWGSVGFFGPLTIRPDLWDQGIAQQLMEPVMACFDTWGVQHAGLFTFPHSPKHLHLYQKFGFFPRFLTFILAKPVAPSKGTIELSLFSQVADHERGELLRACAEVTGAIYEGLDARGEIQAIAKQQLGETVLLWKGAKLVGLACCHCGAGTEAGTDTCYIKFGAVLPGSDAGQQFEQLLHACEALAVAQGCARLVAGVNLGRPEAYHQVLAAGFRAQMVGVAMEKPNEPGYNRAGVYLIDDWR